MKTALKLIAMAVVVVLALVAVAILSLDSLIERGVETAGSYALGVDVTLDGAHLSIPRKSLSLTGFRIANPEGFKSADLFKAERISVALQPKTLLDDEIIIDSIIIEGPSVTVEQSVGGTNLSKLMEKIDAIAGADEKPDKAYRIGLLRITDAEVTFSSFLPGTPAVVVPLTTIEMKDISSEDGTGIALAEVIRQVLVKILQTSLAEGEGVIPGALMKEINGGLRGVVPGLTEELLEQAQGVVEKAAEAIRGLFGN